MSLSKCLIVVDAVKEFVDEGIGDLFLESSRMVMPNIVKKIQEYYENKIPIIYVCDEHTIDDDEVKIFWKPHCLHDTEGSRISEDIPLMYRSTDEPSITIIKKHTYNPFFNTQLNTILSEKLRISPGENIELCGFCTEICILNAALECIIRGYIPIIDPDCTSGIEDELKHHTLRIIDINKGQL